MDIFLIKIRGFPRLFFSIIELDDILFNKIALSLLFHLKMN